MRQEFEIKGRLGSLNDYILECRKSPYCGNHFKHEQQDKVKKAIGESDLIRVQEYPLRVLFFYFESSKKRDLDNISGWAHKCVMDTLVQEQIIDNDGWKQICGYTDYFFIDKENPRLVIVLESVNQEESDPKK